VQERPKNGSLEKGNWRCGKGFSATYWDLVLGGRVASPRDLPAGVMTGRGIQTCDLAFSSSMIIRSVLLLCMPSLACE